jgi:hypothetical protein
MTDESVIQLISSIDEFTKMHEFIDDVQFDQALSSVVKLIMNPAIPAVTAPKLIVQLSAISSALKLKSKYYMYMDKGKAGSQQYIRKEMYITMSERLDDIVAALKYAAKL